MTELSSRIAALSAKKQALLAQRLRAGAGATAAPLIPGRAAEGPARLSFAQERLWFLDRWQPDSPSYNLLEVIRLAGRLDADALAAALRELLHRHEPLRSVFPESEGVPYQVMTPVPGEILPVIDLSALPDPGTTARGLAVTEGRVPFGLASGPVFRARLLRQGAEDHLLVLTLHHIVADQWSLGVILQELGTLYEAARTGGSAPLPELPIRYADFAEWQRGWLAGDVLERQVEYWKQQLRGAPTVLELPADRPRPAAQRFRGATTPFALPAPALEALKALGQAVGGTPFMSSLALFSVLLQRYTGQDDILVGSPVAGRTHPELAPLVGFFVNTLVLRTDLTGDPSFLDLLARVRESTLAAFAHQDLPFEKLVEELHPERDVSRSPLVQVLFAFQNAPVRRLDLPGLTLSSLELDTGTAKLDLSLYLMERDGELAGLVELDTDLFDLPRIPRLIGHFRELLVSAGGYPGRRLSELSLLSEAERRQLVAEWNDTETAFPQGCLLHELFAAQAERSPGAVALRYEGASMTYRELEERSRALAAHLAALGVGPEVLVGICAERSFDMMVGLMGILMAGGAYVPLDPDYPSERLASMLADAAVPVLLTQSHLVDRLPPTQGARRVLLDAEDQPGGTARPGTPPTNAAAPGSAAYAIFTSGSTGRPKGAVNTHRGIVNRILWMQCQYGLRPEDRVLQKTPTSFDVSVWELFWPLAVGARLVLARPGGHRDPGYLVDVIAREGITTLHFVPSLLRVFLEAEGLDRCASLRRVIASGEDLAPETVARFLQHLGPAELHNLYGPTEAAVDVTSWACRDAERVPIGRPIANLRIHVLDRSGQPAPTGVPGELHIGGVGVGRGYLDRPELTAERFVPDPFSPDLGGRLYRTGDLARHRPDGAVEFLGRIDHQVKLRGIRIELGEIEVALARHPGVQAAVATVIEAGGERHLAAWILPAGPPPAPAALREYLRGRLPEPMIPSVFAVLDSLPLTPSGKVDRRALARRAPELLAAGSAAVGPRVAPRTPLEDLLAGIWAEVLRREPGSFGVTDSFFDLGGHSLSTARVVSRVHALCGVDLPVRRLFEAPTISTLAEEVAAARRRGEISAVPPLLPVPRPGPSPRFPLSFAQERLWLLDRLEPGLPAYNIPAALEAEGRLDPAALAAAFGAIVHRHETLRTAFASEEGLPVQVIGAAGPFPLPVLDLSALPAAAGREEARRLAVTEALQPFDLAAGLLLRALLLRRGAESHLLLVTLHHIAGDAWSLEILVRELAALYRARVAGEPLSLPRLSVQYADYAVWQRGWLAGDALASLLAFWKERLADAPQVLEIPTDRPRPPVQTWRGGVIRLLLPRELTAPLTALARASGGTLFMVLLAAWKVLLYRSTRQERLLVGTPVAGRVRRELEGLIGFFVNTLALRTDLEGGLPFTSLLARVRDTALDALAHQDLPFEKLVQELQPRRDASRPPLVQVLFAFQNAPAASLDLPGLTLAPLLFDEVAAKLDLSLSVTEEGGRLAVDVEYNADLYDPARIGRLAGHYRELLQGAAADPGRPIDDLPLLSPSERSQLAIWNDTAAAYPQEPLLHRLIEAQVERTPDAEAVRFEERSLTYRDLDRAANRVAAWLRGRGVGLEEVVGVLLERSLEMVIALLGVLKAGGAYLPLDPSYPQERLDYFRADAAPRVVLTAEAVADLAREASGDPEPPALAETWPDALAYVIYTSGSTGRPKGAMNTHRGIVNRILWMQDVYGLDAHDRVLQKTPFSFDVSVWEFFWPLIVGARLVMARPEGHRDPAYLVDIIAREGITTLHFVPSMLRELLDAEGLSRCMSLRRVIASGEELTADLAARLRARLGWAGLHNLYGPTEAAVDVTFWECGQEITGSVPIGRPIANLQIHLLEPGGQPVPVGVPGELYIGGVGVGRGYLGHPELTAERFVPDPLGPSPGGRLYRTGDLARRRPDGAVTFLGRIDHQVKIRGFRVELGEIEAALAALPGVGGAAVLARDYGPGDRRLVAYLAASGGEAPAPDDIRERLRRSLPEALIPATFVALSALPLSPNGKIDRRALGAIAPDGSSFAGPPCTPPGSPVEETLVEIWQDLLQVARVGIHDSFFDLGGHSLLANRLLVRIRESFGVDLPLRTIFQEPTVARLAEEVLSRQVEQQDEADLERLLAELEEMSDREVREGLAP